MSLTKTHAMQISVLMVLLFSWLPVLPQSPQADEQAVQIEEAFKKIDPRITSLSAQLDRYPPAIKDEAEREKITNEFKSVIKELEKLSQSFPDSASVELRIGECYRLGDNLGLEGAWENSEKHLKRAIELRPDSAKAHIVLGVLYVNTSLDLAPAAEKEFAKALEITRDNPDPTALSGLSFAYYYQGKYKEAVEQADRYLALIPDDEGMKRARKVAAEKAAGAQSSSTAVAEAGQPAVTFKEDSITAFSSVMRFKPPDNKLWKLTKKEYDKERETGRIVFKHLPIKDPQGHEIEPIVALIFERIPGFVDLASYSETSRAQKSMEWREKKRFTSQDGSLSYKDAEGYDGEYAVQGVVHRIIMVFMVHKELGVQIICDSTDGVYDKVENDFRSFIRAVNFE